jgi:nitrite reductase/ring-hydroxylating ferredoxin subunit
MIVLAALAAELRERGGRLVERCRVVDVDRRDAGVRVRSVLGDIDAGVCVLASGVPVLDRGLFFAKLEPSRSFVGAYRPGPTSSPLPSGMYVSAGAPDRSLRTAAGRDGEQLLLVGGGAHVTGRAERTDDELRAIDAWAQQNFGVRDRECWWAAQDYRAHSRIPFAGPLPRGGGRIYAATGYNKWGMTNAVAAALTIAADVLGGHLEWALELRRHAARLPEMRDAIGANAAVAGHLVSGWASAQLRSSDEVGVPVEGEGVVARDGASPVGMAKVDGEVCRVSGVCTHLGGVLNWNAAEQSWDCPLHGSRFAADGRLLEGPAVRDLDRLDDAGPASDGREAVRSADRFRLRRPALAQEDRERHHAAHREQLRLPVLQRAVPEVCGQQVLAERDRRKTVLLLLRAVHDRARESLQQPGGDEDGAHGERERVAVDAAPPPAGARPLRRVGPRVLADELILVGAETLVADLLRLG